MRDGRALSAVFVGSRNLLIQCAERFVANGHEVRAVVSDDATVRRWAEQHRLPVLCPGKDLAARLEGAPFDYLFGIVHLAKLPADVLALPRLGAINFHDGPLPRYAGLHVTSWAILNQEREHGVCWHAMEVEVDRGDILARERFPIEDDDTALTVNARCYEAGLASFGKLLSGLERGTVERRPQDPAQFRYYGKHQRPDNAAIVDWSQPAARIAALVRALQFGPYANPLAEAKVWLNGLPLVVREATILPVVSVLPPGTITGISQDAITVATADFDIHLGGFHSLTAVPVNIREHLTARGLAEGDALEPFAAGEFAQAATRLHADLCRHEWFWTRRLRELEPIEIPFARRRSDGDDPGEGQAVFRMPDEALLAPGADELLLAALSLYFGRIGGKERFDILFQDASAEFPMHGLGALFAERVPMRVALFPEQPFAEFRAAVVDEIASLRKHATYALDLVSRQPELSGAARHWHEAPPTLVIQRLASLEHSTGVADADLTINIAGDGPHSCWHYRTDVFDEPTILRMQHQLAAVLQDAAAGDRPVAEIRILGDAESHELLVARNQTCRDYAQERCVHDLLEAQAERTPHNTAVVFQGADTTYYDLDARANQIARYLLENRHVVPGALVGVLMDRSVEMLAGMIGIWKAGCAYVPLDPAYPHDRLAFMARDAGLATIVSQARYADYLPDARAAIVALDQLADELAAKPATRPVVPSQPGDLAYVIYTSGSTGKPKGVMVEHRNVVNFFAGMDERIDHDAEDAWLAVTSTSFDISVLELIWTLARGFKVVLHSGGEEAATAAARLDAGHAIEFSLFYFASDADEKGRDKYALLLEGAKFADANGFAAVWTPERHFHAFGGLYPNPAVASAALAAITNRVHIRAGSCVLPLHSPIRIAEEWALVDNLSNGRVGISFASGWQPNDFVLAPQAYVARSRTLEEGIQTVRALWRGEAIAFDGPQGKVDIRTLPRPVQPELPFWVTAAGNPETFRMAGELGANLLTHLLGQSLEELATKLEIYRDAWRAAGHAGKPHATLMLHTFVAEDEAYVRATVEAPLKNYLRTATDLVKGYASSFPAFRAGKHSGAEDIDKAFRSLSEDDFDAMLTHAFHRYYETSGLFGTPEGCLAMIHRLQALGIDEVACLIDFGCPSDTVLANLPWLNELRLLAASPGKPPRREDETIPALLEKHRITHLQCTPPLATMLARNKVARERLRDLKCMLVGGEAFPTELAADLQRLMSGRVLNMYGPTETTIWSSTHELAGPAAGGVPLGMPIANTQFYVVDGQLQPVPEGVPGELLIGGHGVVRGYLNRPELTHERFVPSRFGEGEGNLYRTGDLVRWRPDGALEFLGRMDNQVKLRGYRIELGEIEAVLGQHPGVQQAVVVAREDTGGEKRLVGYFVPEPGQRPSVNELRAFLKRSLPEFMVPGAFVALDEFPLTPNKKIDRRSLPAPERSRPDLSENFESPRTATERKLALLWSSVLRLEPIGIHDKFMELGGDSLQAVEVITRVGAEINAAFPLHAFFQAPTIAGMAAALERMAPNQAADWLETERLR
jgi:natural product biosynthesis luciferase-like monooxygenase protein